MAAGLGLRSRRDIGERSRDNIQVIEQLMTTTIPEELKKDGSS